MYSLNRFAAILLYPLIEPSNNKLFANCLDGITEAQCHQRPSGTTNSAAFVAGHLAEARCWGLKILGA